MLAKLIELLEPAGEANVEEIWNHVMDNEAVISVDSLRLDGLTMRFR